MFSACNILLAAANDVQNISTLRLTSMLVVLAGGLLLGYLASNKFHMPEHYAKDIMTIILLVFNWPVALFVIWRLKLELDLIWLPVTGVILMLCVAGLSVPISGLLKLDKKSRMTFLLASSLSNLGYTGGAFVCYALFGFKALAMANLYVVLWLPTAYFIFFPILKIIELRENNLKGGLRMSHIFDLRYMVLPAIFAGLLLNVCGIKQPAFIKDYYIIDFFIYAASILSFFAIGLRVKVSRFKNYIRLYFSLGAVKFMLAPVVACLIIFIIGLAGYPLGDMVKKVIMVMAVTPSAVLVVTMSNVFDLDSRMASALWVVNTGFFALVVVPILYFVFN